MAIVELHNLPPVVYQAPGYSAIIPMGIGRFGAKLVFNVEPLS